MIFLIISGGLCFSLVYFAVQGLRPRPGKRLPGPRGWPIIGSFFDMPDDFEWHFWARFKELYGPVSGVTVLGKNIVLLNTLKPCIEVLENNSSKSSGRPEMPFAGELVGWDQQLLLVPYNNHFRSMRKLAHKFVGTKSAAAAYKDAQEMESKWLISRLHHDPNNIVKHLRTTIGAILLRLSHGYVTRTDGDDLFVNLIEQAAKDFYEATKPGKWLVDIFPWMKHIPSWVPGAGFKRTAEKYRRINIDQTDLPYEFALRSMDDSTALPSFVRSALESGTLTPDEQYALKFCTAAMYGGGLDTMTGYTSCFTLLMILHPEIQKKAQEEIDRVIGPHRLPTLNDRDHLPYITAIQREIYRWGAIVPLGIPHCATHDIVYDGFFIPKDSLIINNIWKISRDSDIYHDPMTFNPERFMGDKMELDPENFAFGFGRRKCPGIEVANSTTFILMAVCLATYTFENPQDRSGKVILLKEDFRPGSVIHPTLFKYSIKPRSKHATELIQLVLRELETVERVPSKI